MNNIELFFTGKKFVIPNYQRDYAWGIENIDDLFEDIFESIESKTSHYIGTFILSKHDNESVFNVVDGQQRLTTITMIINAVIEIINDKTETIINKDKFIISKNEWRLELLNENNTFFKELLENQTVVPENKSQKLLQEAYSHIRNRLNSLSTRNLTAVDFLNSLKSLEIMEFIEKDDGKAIRIFQTVNDRGKPLSNMEKAKSLLIYYSNRYLDGKLDGNINIVFGEIFKIFNTIKEIGEKYSISLIANKSFNEDSVMRYHYIAYENKNYDYNASINDVLELFLKLNLKEIKDDKKSLCNFIKSYIDDILKFFKGFKQIVERIKLEKYYKLLSIQDLSTNLYPLLIRLEIMNLLEESCDYKNYTFFNLIEIADLRVYKIRGTEPVKDISFLAKDASKIGKVAIKDGIINFINNFMNDNEFTNKLSLDIYGNTSLKRIFIEIDENIRKAPYSTDELILINNTIPTIDHIFPQEPCFDFPSHGFGVINDYISNIHKLGNLLLIEKSINSSCKNRSPEKKISDSKLYERSVFETVKIFISDMRTRGTQFNLSDVDDRTNRTKDFILKKWSI
jgi:uncharacterized protein with ParB-like and HNH nuclease domain